MTTFPSPSIPTVTGEVWRSPLDLRVTMTARWFLATNSRAWSGVTWPPRLHLCQQRSACRSPPARVASIREQPRRAVSKKARAARNSRVSSLGRAVRTLASTVCAREDLTVAVTFSRRLLAVVCAGFGRRITTGSSGSDQAVVPDRPEGGAGMEVDGWAEWAGAAPESPPQALPTLISPLELELGELPELVVTWAGRLAGTEDALLWLVEPERERLLVRYGIGRFAASAGRSLHSGEGLAGQVWQTGAPLAVSDYQGWPGRLREAGGQHELQAALCLPLRRDGDVIGVLGVATSKSGRVFDQPEIQQLEGFAEL